MGTSMNNEWYLFAIVRVNFALIEGSSIFDEKSKSKSGQLRLKDFWAHTLACIEEESI